MKVEDQNPWDDFKAEHDDDRNPTLRSLLSGYLLALMLILVVSFIAGVFLLLNAFRHARPADVNDHEFIWGAVVIIGGTMAAGVGFWLSGVREEIRTRHHLERHAREVEEHQRERENNNPFSRLFDERERRERESLSKNVATGAPAKRKGTDLHTPAE